MSGLNITTNLIEKENDSSPLLLRWEFWNNAWRGYKYGCSPQNINFSVYHRHNRWLVWSKFILIIVHHYQYNIIIILFILHQSLMMANKWIDFSCQPYNNEIIVNACSYTLSMLIKLQVKLHNFHQIKRFISLIKV